MHATDIFILRQDQVIESFHLSVLSSLYNFVLLSYRQIDAHAEHEEGLRYLLGYHIMEVSIQPFRKRTAVYFLPFSTRN